MFIIIDKERQEVGGTRTGNPSTEELSVKEVLHQHAYDMDISLMRSIISQAASPPKAISSKRMFFVHLYKTTGKEHTKE